MLLMKKEDYAGGDESSQFCAYCVDDNGELRSCEEIFEGGAGYFTEALGGDRALAERVMRRNMKQLPYWQDKDCAVLEGDVASDEEFQAALGKLG